MGGWVGRPLISLHTGTADLLTHLPGRQGWEGILEQQPCPTPELASRIAQQVEVLAPSLITAPAAQNPVGGRRDPSSESGTPTHIHYIHTQRQTGTYVHTHAFFVKRNSPAATPVSAPTLSGASASPGREGVQV